MVVVMDWWWRIAATTQGIWCMQDNSAYVGQHPPSNLGAGLANREHLCMGGGVCGGLHLVVCSCNNLVVNDKDSTYRDLICLLCLWMMRVRCNYILGDE